jgi:hypothetical protein
VHGGGDEFDLPFAVVFAFSTLPFGDLIALFADPFHQFGVLEDLGDEGSVEIWWRVGNEALQSKLLLSAILGELDSVHLNGEAILIRKRAH